MILETCSRESCVQLVVGLRAALRERDAEIARYKLNSEVLQNLHEQDAAEYNAQRKVLKQALEALREWATLIQHSYTSTSKGMSDLQYADNNGQAAITAIQEVLNANQPE